MSSYLAATPHPRYHSMHLLNVCLYILSFCVSRNFGGREGWKEIQRQQKSVGLFLYSLLYFVIEGYIKHAKIFLYFFYVDPRTS